jgi:hypothetical protein
LAVGVLAQANVDLSFAPAFDHAIPSILLEV